MKLPLRSAIFLLIILTGAFFRFHALDRQSLWDDEMSSINQIGQPANQWLPRFRAYETHPPLYFLQLKTWAKVLPPSLSNLRANSALWGTLALLFFYWLAMEAGLSSGGALTAVALLSFSPYHLAYSQELRPYAFGVVLAILTWALLARAVRKNNNTPSPLEGEGGDGGYRSAKNRPPTSILPLKGEGCSIAHILCGSGILQLYTHYWGGFIWAGQVFFAWMRARSQRKRIIIACVVTLAVFSLWLPVLREQIRNIKDLGFWAPPASPANLWKTFSAYTGTYFRFASSAFILPLERWVLGLITVLYAVLFVLGIRRKPVLAGAWLIFGLGAPFLLSYWKPSVYIWYRYPVLMYPAFLLICAAGIAGINSRLWRAALVVLLLGIDCAGLRHYFANWEKANPQAVVGYVSRQAGDNDVIIRPAYFHDLFSYYYLDDGRKSIVDEHLLGNDPARAMLRGRRIWFISFDVPRDEIREALLRQFKVVSSMDFPGYAHLGITVYELK